MLKKKHRLPIKNFLKKGATTRRSGYFLLKTFDPANNYSRFGVVISRKIFKKPTARNKPKRIIFAFLKTNQNKLPVKDFLIIALPDVIKLNKNAINKELKKIFNFKHN